MPKPITGGELAITYRDFVGNEIEEDKSLWEFQVEPPLKLLFTKIPTENATIEFKYEFERNWSNEGENTFYNHIIGAKIGWSF